MTLSLSSTLHIHDHSSSSSGFATLVLLIVLAWMFVATCPEILSLGRGDWWLVSFAGKKQPGNFNSHKSNHTISALGSHTESTTASNPVQIILLGRRKQTKNGKKRHNTLKHPVSFAKTLASQDLQTATKTEFGISNKYFLYHADTTPPKKRAA